MKKLFTNKNTLALIAVGILVTTGAVSAHVGNMGDRPALTDEQKAVLEQVKELRDSGDIEGAKQLAEDNGLPMFGKMQMLELTDEQKVIVEQAHALMEEGNQEEARQLLIDNGIELGRGHGPVSEEMQAQREAVESAIESNDYSAFVTATENAPFADQVTEDFFAKMVQAHNLRESGDLEGAKAIMDELGIHPMHEGKGMDGERFANLTEEQKAGLAQVKELHEAGDHEGAEALAETLGLPFGPRFNK